MVSDEAKRLEVACIALSRAMDRHACANTDDYGNWKTRKAKTEYVRMDRKLQKLDAQYENALGDN